MTKRKDLQGDPMEDSSSLEPASGVADSLGVSTNNHASTNFQLPASGLKPQLDSIFTEVEKNLPDIDFDLSDIGSDNEEPIIFHQHLKSAVVDEEKDLDTSQSSESLSEMIDNSKLGKESKETEDNQSSDKNLKQDSSTSPIPFYDNDLAFELQQQGLSTSPAEVDSWLQVTGDSETDNKNKSNITSWGSIPHSDQTGGSQNETKPVNQTLVKPDPIHGSKSSDDVKKFADKERKESQARANVSRSETDNEDRQMRKKVEREKSRTMEKELVTNIIPSRAPMLSTETLDNIDLDLLLQSLSEDNQLGPPQPRSAWCPDRRIVESVYAAGEGSRPSASPVADNVEGMTLIQRLAQLTMEQSGEDLSDIDPSTGAAQKPGRDKNTTDNRDLDLDLEDEESEQVQAGRESVAMEKERLEEELASVNVHLDRPADNNSNNIASPKKVTSSCGTNTSDFKPRIITPRVLPPIPPLPEKKSEDKEPTVFIDLRNFDRLRHEQQQNIERVQRVLGISQAKGGNNSSDSEDDLEHWQAQRQKIKRGVTSQSVATDKSRKKSEQSKPSHKQPQRVINLLDQQSPRQRNTDQIDRSTAEDAEARQRAEMEAKEKERRMEIARKLREQKEHERQTKLRLQKRLEGLRPSASVSGRQDSAETTPIIYDLEASYEPAPQSLPKILSPDQDCVLISIHLSSNGEIVLHRGKSNKSVDTGDGLSASYTALVTWLLSLVPDNFAYLQEGGAVTEDTPWILPFYVIGCQQVLLDDQLSLNVAVTPVEQFDARFVPIKSKKAKLKDEVKDRSPFHQHLTKFLSTNSLLTVCPWLQDMVSMEMTSSGQGSEGGYVYKPPLPNITTKPLSTFMQIHPDSQAAAKVFNTSVGFFWQTVDNDERQQEQVLNDEGVGYDTQNTMSLVYKKIFKDPRAMMGIFNRILQEGLDLAGVRLLYPTPELLNLPKVDNSDMQSEIELLNNIGPVLAISLRGTFARSIWLDAVGPSDPSLARRTDPSSLCALYGGLSRDECLLFCPRNQSRVQSELARWFGGRVPPGNVIDVGAPYTRRDTLRTGSPKGRKTKKVTFSDGKGHKDSRDSEFHAGAIHRPMATLTATVKNEIFLVLSTLVPPKCFGIILATCQRRGYQHRGIRRCRLSTKRAASLGIVGNSLKAFCPGTTTSPGLPMSFDDVLSDHLDPHKHGKQQEASAPATVIQLQKENATHSAASLIEACMVQLTLQGIMGEIQNQEDHPLESRHMFHAARYSDSLLQTLGGDFSLCFDPEIQINPNYVVPQLYTSPELEQIAVLLLLGHDVLKTCGLFVGKLLNLMPYSKNPPTLPFSEGLELLGLKWLPMLTPTQAKEVTPCEVGDRKWKDSLHTLTTEPCLVLALRGVNAFSKLESVIPSHSKADKQGAKKHTDMLFSRTAEEAYSYARLFFTERELFSDNTARPMLPYIPHSVSDHEGEGHSKKKKSKLLQQINPNEESIFDLMLSGPQLITTLLVIKPRAVVKHLPKILKKIVQEGFKVVGLKLSYLGDEKASWIIPSDADAELRERHLVYLRSGPSLCVSLQREGAVKKLVDLLGPEDPQSARRNSQFYWRGVFGVDSVVNALHGSVDYHRAVEEQKAFFPDGLCCEETEVSQLEQMTCPAVDSIINIKFSTARSVQTHQEAQQKSDTSITESTHHLLLQTTCIVLTPVLMKKFGSHYGFVDVIEGLVSQGFEMVGARMVWFTREQAENCLCLVEAGSFQQVPLLLSGPCIVLALQRDNAVVAFDSIFAGTYSMESTQGKTTTDSLLGKYDKLILRPPEIKQAHNLLAFFFDELLPNSRVQIVPKSPSQAPAT